MLMSNSILIQNAEVIPMTAGTDGAHARRADILVSGATIEAFGPSLSAPDDSEVINGQNLLVLPGLINAHLHSDESLLRGRYDNLPLEPWMMWSLPLFGYGPFSHRLIYLRTLIGAIEMARCGVTGLVDDVSHSPAPTDHGYDAVLSAYADSGLRARVTANVGDVPELDKVPYLRDVMPADWCERLAGIETASAGDLVALYRRAITRWEGAHGGRLGVGLSCSAPQRATRELMQGLNKLSAEYDLPLHFHVQETRTQAVTGTKFYGRSILSYADSIGLLTERASVIHGVWLDARDVKTLANRASTVIHNPVSNLKLASGIAPLRALRDAHIPVALGTDGASSNDSLNIWDTIKTAALIHKVTSTRPADWPSAAEVVRLCLEGGMRSSRFQAPVGSIFEGGAADLAIFDRETPTLLPTGDPLNLLVYADQGRSLRHVMVDGRWVLKNNQITTVNEKAVVREFSDMLGEFQEQNAKAFETAKRLCDFYFKAHWRCEEDDVNFERRALEAGVFRA